MAWVIYSHENTRNTHDNGAYWYSVELCKYIIPKIRTSRPWFTIKIGDMCLDHAIYFIHSNLRLEKYAFLKEYKDIIAVCGTPETAEAMKEYVDHTVYLPLSVNVSFVQQFQQEKKDRTVCYAGRSGKPGIELVKALAHPDIPDMLCDMPRKQLLSELGHYRYVFAVGRTAIEAKILGCHILPYDIRYPDPSFWQVISNQEAIPMLQAALDTIDMV